MNSSGKRLIFFAQSMLSTFKSSQHSMSSVTVYTRLCMMYLEVYVHMIACISTRCNVYVGMHTSRLDDMMMRVSRLDSVFSIDMRDDEWCWESRLDFMIWWYVSTRFSENLWESRLEFSIKSRLDFCVGFWIFSTRVLDKPPVSCYARLVHNTSAHSIQILNALPTEFKQITKRNKLLFYI